MYITRRSPRGERGLKSTIKNQTGSMGLSFPVRGTWVEMIFKALPRAGLILSFPVRETWVEMNCRRISPHTDFVVPREGNVD